MMPTKRFSKKYWKMVIVLITLCAALLLLRWAAMLWGSSSLPCIVAYAYSFLFAKPNEYKLTF